jgi:hypothetical protein
MSVTVRLEPLVVYFDIFEMMVDYKHFGNVGEDANDSDGYRSLLRS